MNLLQAYVILAGPNIRVFVYMRQTELNHTVTNELELVVQSIGQVILGKDHQIRLSLACLVAKGHLLIEDMPGAGKTTLAHVIAQVMGLDFHRIQFTSDLLPADVLGLSIYNRERNDFEFHPGPIFSNLVLADEVNRATPKTQSALLEAMEERQITAEGETRPLPQPFFVIATQNPLHQIGTFPLPESQLDRFLMRVHLGFPGHSAERELLQGTDRREMIAALQPVLEAGRLEVLQEKASQLYVSDALLDYVQAILAFSRESSHFEFGLSPRGGLALLNSSRAWAMISGHDFVVPEHVKAVMPEVVNHRLQVSSESLKGEQQSESAAEIIADSVPIP